MLRKHKTHKLFWNKFLYKATYVNRLATIFRNKKLHVALNEIEYLEQKDSEGVNPLYRKPRDGRSPFYEEQPIPQDHLYDARVIYNTLVNAYDKYTLRVEGSHFHLFTNEPDLIETLNKHITCFEYWEPENQDIADFLLSNEKIVLSDKPLDYEYKLYLGNRCDKGFASFIKKNPTGIKAGYKCLTAIESGHWTEGFYVWAKNRKWADLALIAAGSHINKIVKHVYKA